MFQEVVLGENLSLMGMKYKMIFQGLTSGLGSITQVYSGKEPGTLKVTILSRVNQGLCLQ